ncbi:MAG: hypothetical protein Q9171_004740 [Xanthocarpia ochracea]
MQRTTDDWSTYQDAAAPDVQMEDHRANPELSSQPHAPDMHAAVANVSTDAYLPDHTTNTSLHEALQIVTPASHDILYGGTQGSQHAVFLPCRYPGCFAVFQSQPMLQEHSKVHFPTPRSMPILGGSDCSSTMFHDPPNYDIALNTVRSSVPFIGNGPCLQAVYGYPETYPTMTTPGAFTTAPLMPTSYPYGSTLNDLPSAPLIGASESTQASDGYPPIYPIMATPGAPSMPTSYAYGNNTAISIGGNAMGIGYPFPATTPEASTSASTPTANKIPPGRFPCSFHGCTTTCARLTDLERHMMIHKPGPKQFNCPNAGCPRKGVNGFDRKDKRDLHQKTCGGGRARRAASHV